MRKSYFLALLFACAACSDDGALNDPSPSHDEGSKSSPASTSLGAAAGEAESAGNAVAATTAAASPGAPGPSAGFGMSSSAGSTSAGGSSATGGAGGIPPSASSGAATLGSAGASAPRDAASGGVAATPASAPLPSSPTMPIVAPVQPVPQGGQLTAGTWDDNLNYARFKQFKSQVAQVRTGGILPFTAADFDAAHDKFSAPRSAHQQLDVALVIDTTGSMGDEIAYLQREFSDLSKAIESAYPSAAQRWALVVYKDVGDQYVTRQFDFRTDLNALRTDLAAESAGGGGDFPEAPDAAFAQLNQFQWRGGAGVARLAFWVADAPHHDEKAGALAAALRTAQGQDIHVYPVASSGINEFTELTMRSAAQLTGGRYLFLTNDSGIGGAHKEPSIPCYFVTRLDHAILRVIDIEMSGKYHEPTTAQIIRTGGNPKDGACALDSGELTVF